MTKIVYDKLPAGIQQSLASHIRTYLNARTFKCIRKQYTLLGGHFSHPSFPKQSAMKKPQFIDQWLTRLSIDQHFRDQVIHKYWQHIYDSLTPQHQQLVTQTHSGVSESNTILPNTVKYNEYKLEAIGETLERVGEIRMHQTDALLSYVNNKVAYQPYKLHRPFRQDEQQQLQQSQSEDINYPNTHVIGQKMLLQSSLPQVHDHVQYISNCLKYFNINPQLKHSHLHSHHSKYMYSAEELQFMLHNQKQNQMAVYVSEQLSDGFSHLLWPKGHGKVIQKQKRKVKTVLQAIKVLTAVRELNYETARSAKAKYIQSMSKLLCNINNGHTDTEIDIGDSVCQSMHRNLVVLIEELSAQKSEQQVGSRVAEVIDAAHMCNQHLLNQFGPTQFRILISAVCQLATNATHNKKCKHQPQQQQQGNNKQNGGELEYLGGVAQVLNRLVVSHKVMQQYIQQYTQKCTQQPSSSRVSVHASDNSQHPYNMSQICSQLCMQYLEWLPSNSQQCSVPHLLTTYQALANIQALIPHSNSNVYDTQLYQQTIDGVLHNTYVYFQQQEPQLMQPQLVCRLVVWVEQVFGEELPEPIITGIVNTLQLLADYVMDKQTLLSVVGLLSRHSPVGQLSGDQVGAIVLPYCSVGYFETRHTLMFLDVITKYGLAPTRQALCDLIYGIDVQALQTETDNNKKILMYLQSTIDKYISDSGTKQELVQYLHGH